MQSNNYTNSPLAHKSSFFCSLPFLMASPSDYYFSKKQQFSLLLSSADKQISQIAMFRLWVAIGGLGLGVWAFRSGVDYYWWFAGIATLLFLYLVKRHQVLSTKREELKLNLFLIDTELQALDGNFSSYDNGLVNANIKHPYTYDLDIFGIGSVYQSLARTVTIGGASLLATRLSSLSLEIGTITQRQQIINELAAIPDFLLNFRVAGLIVKEGPKDQERITKWLGAEDLFINNLLVKIMSVLMPTLSIIGIIWSFYIGGMCPWLIYVVLINWLLMGTFSKKVKISIAQMGNCATLIDKYTSILMQVASTEFKDEWLKKSAVDAAKNLEGINKFKKLAHLFENRSNGLTGPIMNTLFIFDFYCLLQLEGWRKDNKQALLSAMDNMIEMDVYISNAVYAFNNPQFKYPEITAPGTEMRATNLRHPLLNQKNAVGNNVSMGKNEKFYLLTGANMTGKSTFIRTIGVSIVLANLGLPLPANEISLPIFQLFTSMRITDSVQDDISYFRAELNRIKMVMDNVKAATTPYLILLDEPLRGTNSTDKQQGTRSIVETLLKYHSMGIIATHDTGLCDMEPSHPGKINNYYFESKVEAGGLSFDFKLKRGGSTSNNATILMRQMGIIE